MLWRVHNPATSSNNSGAMIEAVTECASVFSGTNGNGTPLPDNRGEVVAQRVGRFRSSGDITLFLNRAYDLF